MRRSAFDKLISWTGLALAALLVVAGGLATWASSFIGDQVESQLVSQKIVMPEGEALKSLSDKDREALEPFAGSKLDSGDEARAFADNYILAHMNASSGNRTYEEVSGEFMALSDEEKASEAGQQVAALRQSLFMGNTLRGMLLNAYAFGTMGTIAGLAAIASFVGAALLAVLALLGLRHASTKEAELATI
ncbi:hypothetical protein GL325_09615 [Aeromicrobium sp. 636]|uniref:Aromatic ring-opening dioxygenase LigA n=1 Tax=Aeromicrobium senzhongii TaxID=2663859 RepID=A0A8I0EWY5_9ACTN|nr:MULTISPECIES: hypothetical protein [Aeromicrobium]MBC9226580.1 hypothetical protein [Aeromicrobium senzhongii]MCQ3998681.1 hypothetical protein [Aeromicrobium sp. 636]MTB89110.1 hypothetical protein [Aeromicrobium senzhongii]QNL93622.1 hypothetical protein H9L21_10925 [Aeromicrobium senzhongii]